jgi:Right handed beta helix region
MQHFFVVVVVALFGVCFSSACSGDRSGSMPSGAGAAGIPTAGVGQIDGGNPAVVDAGAAGRSGASAGTMSSAGADAVSGSSGASGASAAGGVGGAMTVAGASGGGGAGGAAGSTSTASAGTNAPTGGATDGAGKACHSTADWTPQAGDIWISPDGSDSSDGTEASPKKNLTAAISAWSSGKTIWVMPGTYAYAEPINISTSATSSGPLRISGATGGAKPVFDFSSEPRASSNDGSRGFQLSGSYVHLRYLEIKKAADNCVYVTGTNNTLEWLTIYECQDTGVQLSNGAADNKVLNIDSYLNADPGGENADGFAPKLDIGQNNYFCGTRAYQNADDGYDCWASGDSSPVTFEYCWAFGQPGPTATAAGDGNGFKLGSPTSRASGGNAPHKLIDCFAFGNRSVGFTANGNNSGEITCTGCGVWDNGTAWSPGTGGAEPQHTGDITNLDVTPDEAMNAPRDASGNLPDIETL